MTATATHPISSGRTDRRARITPFGIAPFGIAAFILIAAGMSGVGDALPPNDSPASMAAHFRDARSAVLAAAPIGIIGALALTTFVVGIAVGLIRRGQLVAAIATGGGGAVAAGYVLVTQVIYSSLAYPTVAPSPDVTKGLFVLTIIATPIFGLAVSVTLLAAATGATASASMPRWWAIATIAGAVGASVATCSYADSGYFSPDVQQQVVGNILQIWLLLTSIALAAGRRQDRQAIPASRRGPLPSTA